MSDVGPEQSRLFPMSPNHLNHLPFVPAVVQPLLVLGMLIMLIMLVGCPDDPPSGGVGGAADTGTSRGEEPFRVTAELVAENNRGAGLMEQYKYQAAMKVFQPLVDAHPEWLDARVNLGIAVLNFTQKGAAAVSILEQVVAEDPDHAAATYCLGVSLFHATRIAQARVQFERAVEQDPLDAHSAYFLARCLEEDEPIRAVELHLKALELEPYFQSAHYRCFDLLRQFEGRFDDAMKHMDEFKLLNEHPLSVAFAYKYTLMGPKAMAIRVGLDGSETPTAKRPDGRLFDPAAEIPAAASARVSAGAALTTVDINADGHQDLFVVTSTGNLVMLGAGSGKGLDGFTLAKDHPLARVSNVTAPLWGDFDNDGLLDVYLCRKGLNQLWRQVKAGQWEDITAKSKAGGADAETLDGVCLDLDHDADLDLLLIHRDQPAQLLNNNRDGTFEDISARVGVDRSGVVSASAVVADFDSDRDLDILLLGPLGKPGGKSSGNVLLYNDRAWRYHADKKLGELAGAATAAAVAGDTNADGQVELYAVDSTKSASVVRWTRKPDGTWDKMQLGFGDVEGTIGEGSPRIALSDVTGDGQVELLVGTSGWSAWQLPSSVKDAKDAKLIELADSGEHDALGAWTPVVLDDALGPAIVGTVVDGAVLAWTAGSGRHPFVTIALTGLKKGRNRERSNASGLGSIVLARAAGRTLRADSLPADSGSGQSLQPVTLGLGGLAQADFVKIVWSEGVTQGELGVVAGKRHAIEEVDLMPTSCPVLFVWDGTRYRFVSDLLGVGGLGYLVEPGTYAPADPTENFLLPEGLARAAEGRLKLKLTEPMPELTYLDRVGLVAWDLPPGWQMVLDERLATSLPDPSGLPIAYRHEQSPIRVTNERGEDVTDQVVRVDQRAADVGRLDHRFLGRLAAEHVLVMEFAEPLDVGPGEPVLLADGWVEFPYSQTAFSAWQAGAAFQSPTLEARDADGNWVELASEFGYPGGMPRQMTLKLPSRKLPAGTRALRLRTNLEVYWDRLTVVRQEDCPQLVRRELKLVGAQLRESGFMVRQLREQFRPHFDYATRAAHPEIIDPAGFYTRFGGVEELVGAADDAVAIFGPGEEIHFEFEAAGVEVPAGWTRRLVLETVGWCKDMDLYTGEGSTVAPLPTTGRPVGVRDALHRKYNTRYQRGW